MIVGLTGKKRAGKDTVANVLVEEFGFERVAFADVMKDAALALDPLIPDGLFLSRLSTIVREDGWERAKDRHKEVRRTLQRLGTELGRNLFGEDFWVERALAPLEPGYRDYVITDCRFPNEADAVRALSGGKIFRVLRPAIVSTDSHASEVAMDGYEVDAEILNETTIEALQQTTRSLMKYL